jgi:hypothetical protein
MRIRMRVENNKYIYCVFSVKKTVTVGFRITAIILQLDFSL